MPEIYQAAKATVARLGEAMAKSDIAMEFINTIAMKAAQMDLSLLRAGSYRDEFLALVGGILIRPWWHRIWIVQEITVSKDIEVARGSKPTSWESRYYR